MRRRVRQSYKPLTERAPLYHPDKPHRRIISCANGLWQAQERAADQSWAGGFAPTTKRIALEQMSYTGSITD